MKSRSKDNRVLTGASAVICEDHAYFIGTVAECASFIKGYNERQTDDGDPTPFEIVPTASVNLAT